MPLQPLANSRPFLKLGIQGFAGDGKTLTAAKIAVGLHRMIKSRKPIAIYDTERASKALKPFFNEEGIDALVDDSNRSLAGLLATIKECVDGASDILLVDSVTHIWENFTEAYKNERRRTRLSFEDWSVLKPRWRAQFSETFVMSPLHIIFTGRAGYEYTSEKDDEGKKQIQKTGVKMKAEGETAFEPDILVNMDQIQDILGEEKKIWRIATIIKDRSRLIDGMTLNKDGKKKGPDFEDFEPAIASLLNGVAFTNKNPVLINDSFGSNFDPDKDAKELLIAEIRDELTLLFPGTTAVDAQMKIWALKNIWGSSAMEKLVFCKLTDLEWGVAVLNSFSAKWTHYMNELRESNGFVDREHVLEMMKYCKFSIQRNAK